LFAHMVRQSPFTQHTTFRNFFHNSGILNSSPHITKLFTNSTIIHVFNNDIIHSSDKF